MQIDADSLDGLQVLSGGVVVIAVIGFLLLLAILWTILPFAVFGIKRRLDKISSQLAALIDLEAQARERDQGGSKPPSLRSKSDDRWTGLTSAELNDAHRKRPE